MAANYERIKTGASRLSLARVIRCGGNLQLADAIRGRMAAANARRIS